MIELAIYPSQYLRGSEKCFLLIHGYTGSPYEMMYIAEGINRNLGWTVRVPRLPGHSTFTEDFLETTRRDWKRRVFDEFLDMKSCCEEIVVGGLSMGGILSVILASKFNIERVVLYAPAFLTAFQKYIPLTMVLSTFLRKTKKKNPPKEEEDPVKRRLREEYWVYNFYKQSWEFFKLQFEGRKKLPEFSGEALVVVSKSDRTVPINVKDYLDKNMGGRKKFVILEKSQHVLTVDIEKEKVLEETLKFLKG